MRFAHLAAIFAVSFFFPLDAFADIVVDLSGEITEGMLDGDSLVGQSFLISASIIDTTDRDIYEDNGSFLTNAATIRFGDGRSFQFDDNTLGFAQYYGEILPGDPRYFFAASFILGDLELSGESLDYLTAQGFAPDPSDPPFNGFDPEILAPFSYNQFTISEASGSGASGAFEISNVAGSSLRIDSFALPSAVNVSAVPEPGSSMVLASAILVAVASRRHRKR